MVTVSGNIRFFCIYMLLFHELKIVFNTDCQIIHEKLVRHHLSDYKMMNMKGILTLNTFKSPLMYAAYLFENMMIYLPECTIDLSYSI